MAFEIKRFKGKISMSRLLNKFKNNWSIWKGGKQYIVKRRNMNVSYVESIYIHFITFGNFTAIISAGDCWIFLCLIWKRKRDSHVLWQWVMIWNKQGVCVMFVYCNKHPRALVKYCLSSTVSLVGKVCKYTNIVEFIYIFVWFIFYPFIYHHSSPNFEVFIDFQIVIVK